MIGAWFGVLTLVHAHLLARLIVTDAPAVITGYTLLLFLCLCLVTVSEMLGPGGQS